MLKHAFRKMFGYLLSSFLLESYVLSTTLKLFSFPLESYVLSTTLKLFSFPLESYVLSTTLKLFSFPLESYVLSTTLKLFSFPLESSTFFLIQLLTPSTPSLLQPVKFLGSKVHTYMDTKSIFSIVIILIT